MFLVTGVVDLLAAGADGVEADATLVVFASADRAGGRELGEGDIPVVGSHGSSSWLVGDRKKTPRLKMTRRK